MGHDQRYKEKHWMHMNYQPLVQNFRYITIFDKWSCIFIYIDREAIVLVTSNSLRTGS